MSYCEDCGCKVYNGHCTNCHEEVFIAEQHLEQGTFNECSDEFKQKVAEQLNYPEINTNDYQEANP
jgi:hypothetical protein